MRFLAANIACSVFQFIVLLILGAMFSVMRLISGSFFWDISEHHQSGLSIVLLVSYAIFFGSCYAFVWFVYWFVQFNDGIKWFYWKVAFSTLPLVTLLIIFNPKPNPMAMIPMSIAEYQFEFSCIVTGIILFPLYSVSIYKFVLQSSAHKVRNTTVLCSVLLLLGSVLFVSSWNMMPIIYQGIEYSAPF
jgi:hypothetical protein